MEKRERRFSILQSRIFYMRGRQVMCKAPTNLVFVRGDEGTNIRAAHGRSVSAYRKLPGIPNSLPIRPTCLHESISGSHVIKVCKV